jgi:hypothetical protein
MMLPIEGEAAVSAAVPPQPTRISPVCSAGALAADDRHGAAVRS